MTQWSTQPSKDATPVSPTGWAGTDPWAVPEGQDRPAERLWRPRRLTAVIVIAVLSGILAAVVS